MNEKLKKEIKEPLGFSVALTLTSVFGTLYARFQIIDSPTLVPFFQKAVVYCFCLFSIITSVVLLGCTVWKIIKYKWQKHKQKHPLTIGRAGSGMARGFIKPEITDMEEEEE